MDIDLMDVFLTKCLKTPPKNKKTHSNPAYVVMGVLKLTLNVNKGDTYFFMVKYPLML